MSMRSSRCGPGSSSVRRVFGNRSGRQRHRGSNRPWHTSGNMDGLSITLPASATTGAHSLTSSKTGARTKPRRASRSTGPRSHLEPVPGPPTARLRSPDRAGGQRLCRHLPGRQLLLQCADPSGRHVLGSLVHRTRVASGGPPNLGRGGWGQHHRDVLLVHCEASDHLLPEPGRERRCHHPCRHRGSARQLERDRPPRHHAARHQPGPPGD